MKTTNRRTTRRTTGHRTRNAIGHGADPLRMPEHTPESGAHGNGPVSVGPGTYEVRCDVVPTHQGPGPAQIPWLKEIRGDQHLNDSYSGVI
ncbi:hypothetical protein [Paeniglutamicibacter psychrophenolicus]|uniref:hypothetical protein n=1 Tax=Paeniglutamicibacter psychrophenolicus TaxID=257454 RepID=UPI00277F64D7|nr:hypothetical protein [Paeniglutamicibacter psychrophenolicus]MDQ0096261.1 hypothetical protein [Paeniglutamicibacter psychrophenolicus]